jgi:hypothetical protein
MRSHEILCADLRTRVHALTSLRSNEVNIMASPAQTVLQQAALLCHDWAG